MSTGRTARDWRGAAREAAAAQAEAEARAAWDLDPAARLPFNHRWEHVQQVVGLALWLAEATGADKEVAEAAAWLHDVRKDEPNHGAAGAAAAQEILTATDFPPEKVATVVAAIWQHASLYRPAHAPPLTPIEAAVLWDADKLTKLGVQALMYNLSAAYARGKTLDERRADYLRFATTVLARTAASMNTAPAQALAARRYAAMMDVLRTWAEEAREGESYLEVSSDHVGMSEE
jgi:uncharacterized protein